MQERIIPFAVVTLIVINLILLPCINPDIWWHLSCGRYILNQGTIPQADFLSHTLAGQPWLDFEWLVQVIFYLVYKLGGCLGLIVLRALVLGSAAACVERLLALYGLSATARCLSLAWLAILLLVDVRPDNFSLLFFSLLFYILESLRLRKIKQSSWLRIGIFLLFALWGNMHLASTYGLLLIGFYALGEGLQALATKSKKLSREEFKLTKDYATLFALGLAASLLNPYGIRIYQVLLEHWFALSKLSESIQEWTMPEVTEAVSWSYWVLLAACMAAMLAHFLRKREISYSLLFATGYFALASASHRRHIFYFCVIALPVLCLHLREIPLEGIARRIWYWVNSLLLISCWVLFSWPAIVNTPALSRCSMLGFGAAAFLTQNTQALSGKKLYNPYEQGGYFGFRLYPNYRVFYDGRYIFHPLLLEYQAAMRTPASWQNFLEKYGIEIACISRLEPPTLEILNLGGKKLTLLRPYYARYMPQKRWGLVYWDARDLIFVRRSSADPSWLSAHEYRSLRPDDEEYIHALITHGRLRKADLKQELARHLRDTKDRGREGTYLAYWLRTLEPQHR